ncbi:hypothetical protein ONV78_16785 [Hahella sp. CR1]|uniref:hypothetical protein n=1 Tax=Hahella sp. CR1 TaxID=2992807 RepID=UPI0024411FB0|nr:hypothetical protein [Hahella sp. CR1]MDG9669397.1 hypothetical protein [Hahella sp. CR1]
MWNELERVMASLRNTTPLYTTPYFVDIPGSTSKGQRAIKIVASESPLRFNFVLGDGANSRTVKWLPWEEGGVTKLKLNREGADYWFVTAALSGCSVGFDRNKGEVFHLNGGYSDIPADLRQTSDFLCPLQSATGLTLDAWAQGAGVRSNTNSNITQYGSIRRKDAVPARPAKTTGPAFLRRARPAEPAKYMTDIARATVIGRVSGGTLTLAYQDISEQGKQLYPWYEITTAVLA